MRGLLADIAAAGAESPRPSRADARRELRDAVLDHLAFLSATPRGSMLLAPGLGVDDTTHVFHEYPGSVEELRVRLEETLRVYEPRLLGARVRHVVGDAVDLVVRFEIHATLAHEGRALPVHFTTTIDGDSRVAWA